MPLKISSSDLLFVGHHDRVRCDALEIVLVTFRGRVFGLTCSHVLNGFDWRQLRVTEAKFGKMFAPILTASC
jgi:hypothetical protein